MDVCHRRVFFFFSRSTSCMALLLDLLKFIALLVHLLEFGGEEEVILRVSYILFSLRSANACRFFVSICRVCSLPAHFTTLARCGPCVYA